MSKIGDKIIEALQEFRGHAIAYAEFDHDAFGFGKVEVFNRQTGDINNTSYCHSVLYFKEHDTYIKVNGWYSSYSGCREWEDYELSEVKPQTKQITVWE